MPRAPRIVLIHALRLSVEPIVASFQRHWPEAELANLLDDSLSVDRARDGELTEAMNERFLTLGHYAVDQARADAILFTCSAFGLAIDQVVEALSIPVQKPNTAMIEQATAMGGKVGLMATFSATLDSMVPEFPEEVLLHTAVVQGALNAAERGDGEAHDRLCAKSARQMVDCDLIALAQFSMARAQWAVAAATGKPVLTTPDCAVLALRARF